MPLVQFKDIYTSASIFVHSILAEAFNVKKTTLVNQVDVSLEKMYKIKLKWQKSREENWKIKKKTR